MPGEGLPPPPQIALVVGTRPEAIKLLPLARALQHDDRLGVQWISTGQHAAEVERILADDASPVVALPFAAADPRWRRSAARLQRVLADILAGLPVAAVVVQGDTLSAYAGARATRALRRPLIHVEAGLRSPRRDDPFPEDLIRRRIGRLADWHFAPTALALANLRREQAAGRLRGALFQVGSTAIDALCAQPKLATPDFDLLVTLHRRENRGEALLHLGEALAQVMQQRTALRVAWIAHPRADWNATVRAIVDRLPGLHWLPPQPHARFLALAAGAGRVVSDSGGLQEELPVLGVRQLVLRRCTERPEGLRSGHAWLCDPRSPALADTLQRLIDCPRPAPLLPGVNCPWGDGHAAQRIAAVLGDAFAAPQALRRHG